MLQGRAEELWPVALRSRCPLFDQLIMNLYEPGDGICSHVDLMRFQVWGVRQSGSDTSLPAAGLLLGRCPSSPKTLGCSLQDGIANISFLSPCVMTFRRAGTPSEPKEHRVSFQSVASTCWCHVATGLHLLPAWPPLPASAHRLLPSRGVKGGLTSCGDPSLRRCCSNRGTCFCYTERRGTSGSMA